MTEFDPELVEQAARAIRESPLTLAATPEAFAQAVLTAVAPVLRAKGAAEAANAFVKWAAKNEIAEPPLDWAWFGEIARRYADAARAATEDEANLAVAYNLGCRDGSTLTMKALGVSPLSPESMRATDIIDTELDNPYLTPGAETFMQEFRALVIEKADAYDEGWKRGMVEGGKRVLAVVEAVLDAPTVFPICQMLGAAREAVARIEGGA